MAHLRGPLHAHGRCGWSLAPLQPGLALAIVALCGGNQRMEDLSVTVFQKFPCLIGLLLLSQFEPEHQRCAGELLADAGGCPGYACSECPPSPSSFGCWGMVTPVPPRREFRGPWHTEPVGSSDRLCLFLGDCVKSGRSADGSVRGGARGSPTAMEKAGVTLPGGALCAPGLPVSFPEGPAENLQLLQVLWLARE